MILVLVVLGPQFGNSVQGSLHETGTEAQWSQRSRTRCCLFFKREKSIWWRIQVALVVKNPRANEQVVRDAGSIPGMGKSPRGGNGTHSSILTWRIPWIEEPDGPQSMGSQSRTWLKHSARVHAHTLQGHTESSTPFQPAEGQVKVLWTFQTPRTLEASV